MSHETEMQALLLLAARAAGYSVQHMDGEGLVLQDAQGIRTWNPLQSEADRYRLLRDLNMTIEFDLHQVGVCLPNQVFAWESWGEGLEARTDAQAIVQLAAKAGSLRP